MKCRAERLKTIGEIRLLHDFALSLTEDNFPFTLPQGVIDYIWALRDAMCWCMGHERGKEVDRFIERVNEIIESQGFKLLPLPPGDPRRNGFTDDGK